MKAVIRKLLHEIYAQFVGNFFSRIFKVENLHRVKYFETYCNTYNPRILKTRQTHIVNPIDLICLQQRNEGMYNQSKNAHS